MTPPLTPETVQIVRELRPGKRQACLVKRGEEYFVVHNTTPPKDAGSRLRGVLVFACDPRGAITDWCAVAGGEGVSREEAIAELAAGHDSSRSTT